MTIDVEDYFQVSAFAKHISRADWPTLPCRIERNIDIILSLLHDHNVQATFFTLGWIAERYPAMLRRIADNGHELASHGYHHFRVNEQTADEFREDVGSSKTLLEDIVGQKIKGYRAPSFSIGAKNIWALDVLHDEGYEYSSSIYPIRHDHYGMPEAPRFGFRPSGTDGIIEIPATTASLFGRNIPAAGGGYFRLMPYQFSRWLMRRVNAMDGESCIFYFHPWELDPGQPRQLGIGVKTRFRHYINLSKMEAKISSLLSDFQWDRMDNIFLGQKT